jgi:hypothetical protein
VSFNALFNQKWVRAIFQATVAMMLLSLILSGCGGGGSGGNDTTAHTDATLSSLNLTGASLDQLFQPSQTSYTARVNFQTASINLSPIATSAGATIRINDTVIPSGTTSQTIPLAEGQNQVSLEVIAEDGVTTQRYTIEILRVSAAYSDATLSSLILNGASLDQLFQPSQTSYTASANLQTASINLSPVATSAGATIRINDTVIPSGTTSQAIPLAEGQNLVSLVVTAEDGVTTQRYTIEVLRVSAALFAQQAYLKASNADADDRFGTGVAISADTLVVGAPHTVRYGTDSSADNSTADPGAAYIFTRSGGVWSQQAVLMASNAERGWAENYSAAFLFTNVGDLFGYSVAISDDTVVVGAPFEDSSVGSGGMNNSQYNSGAAYVFTRSNGVWRQQALIKASNTGAFDEFGTSVAISGDTLVVGAPGESSGGTYNLNEAGAAYVFTRSSGVWSQQAFLKAGDVNADDRFGASVAISGDTLVVGAPFEDSSASGSETDNSVSGAGAAYVFTRSSGVWSQQAFLKATDAEEFDYFGTSVAITGETLVVGAPQEDSKVTIGEGDNSITDSGAAYVFTRSDGIWTQQAFLKANYAGMNDLFATSLAISGDTLVVGAIGEDSNTSDSEIDNSAFDAGAAYIFTRSNGIWNQQSFLKASNAEANDKLGTSVAISGDTVVAGAPFENSSASGGEADNSAASAGAAYVWQ